MTTISEEQVFGMPKEAAERYAEFREARIAQMKAKGEYISYKYITELYELRARKMSYLGFYAHWENPNKPIQAIIDDCRRWVIRLSAQIDGINERLNSGVAYCVYDYGITNSGAGHCRYGR